MRSYRPHNRRSAEEIAAEKAEADRLAMTCQCCGRRIYAQTGVIAHHGYTRPYRGCGWQTGSCMGARHLPYEADRAVLGELIDIMEGALVAHAKARFDVQAEREPVPFIYRDYSGQDSRGTNRMLGLTRDNFEQMRKEHMRLFLQQMDCRTFDELKDRHLRAARFELMRGARELRIQRKRFAEWKQTHTFSTFYNPPQWVKVTAD